MTGFQEAISDLHAMLATVITLLTFAAVERISALPLSARGTRMTTTAIDTERLAQVTKLSKGNHKPPNGEFEACVMEATSWVAGEPWSDHPKCTCPVITAFMVAWNDALPDSERHILLPLIPHLIGTKASKALQNRRATMAADWFVRVHTPAWLRLAGLTEHADALANFPEITDFAKTPSLMPVLEAAKTNGAAAWDAAGAAAEAAAGAAAGAVAGAVAWAVAWAAAGAVAWAAAWA